MKTKFFTALALAAALFIGQPAFAASHKGGAKHGGGGHVAATHRGGGHTTHAVASAHTGGGHMRTFAARGGAGFRPTRVTTARTAPAPATTAVARTRGAGTATPSMAFGGNSNTNNSGRSNGNGRGNYTYAFASHPGWNQNQGYFWLGHNYRWFNNAWYIIDPNPYVYYSPGYNGPSEYNTDTIGVQVQQDLAHDGYYNGPIDGVVGPGTQTAISAYQSANGLPVTGAIDQNLLNSLNGG